MQAIRFPFLYESNLYTPAVIGKNRLGTVPRIVTTAQHYGMTISRPIGIYSLTKPMTIKNGMINDIEMRTDDM